MFAANEHGRSEWHPLLFKEIVGVLESSRNEAGALILEITETVMMEGDEYLIDQLRELKPRASSSLLTTSVKATLAFSTSAASRWTT